MKVIDLQGKTHSWNLSTYNNQRKTCSSLHLQCRELLKEIFPLEVILEEVSLPGTQLYLDFYIHSKRLGIEVNGEQHYKHNSFHFKTKHDFYKAGKRDRVKAEWLDLNGIQLVVLPYSETTDEWRKRITDRNS